VPLSRLDLLPKPITERERIMKRSDLTEKILDIRVKLTMTGKFLPYKYYGATEGHATLGYKEK
jgi:hypothetical protein